MHQTFYIDIEEEISSVIDRLNKSMSDDNYFVVPKRALFLQSIVNLKLLRREADKIGKKVVIVTQDEIGMSMAERSGLEVLPNLDSLEPTAGSVTEALEIENSLNSFNDQVDHIESARLEQDKMIRLGSVGSSEFYASARSQDFQNKKVKILTKALPEKRIQQSISNDISSDAKMPQKSLRDQYQDTIATKAQLSQNSLDPSKYKKLDPNKYKSLEKMYSSTKTEKNINKKEGGAKKFIVIFVLLCLTLLVCIGAYLFFPSAKIIITPNVKEEKLDLNLVADSGALEISQSLIPAKVLSQDEEITLSYDVTSASSMSGKKAHGSVVIYNEYDNNPQTLVATTRLESENGKIFRLLKSVVIPGMINVAGEVKPGAVSVDVVADQAGEDYNVEQGKFSIPGFKGGPKFDKFYAKSSNSMVGGSLNSDSGTIGGKVSQVDLDNAKQKTENALREKFDANISDKLEEGQVYIPQTEKIAIVTSAANVKNGDLVESFDYSISATVSYFVFAEKDLRELIKNSIKDSAKRSDISQDIIKIEYGAVDANFEDKKLNFKVHAQASTTPNIDLESIKKELLGKRDDQLSMILRMYPDIKNINIEFSPSFISRIPQYTKRVNIEIATVSPE